MSAEEVSNAEANLKMVDAITELVKTIKRINAAFIALAIIVPIVILAFMFGLAMYIVEVQRIAKEDLEKQVNQRADEVISRIQNINQNQTINLQQQGEDPAKSLAKEILLKRGKI